MALPSTPATRGALPEGHAFAIRGGLRVAGGVRPPPPGEQLRAVAIFRLSLKGVSRSDGRDAVACAAYRAGARLVSERTGQAHDYRRKGRGLARAALVGWTGSRSDLWNAAERAERRKNSQVAREVQLALPDELSAAARFAASMGFARWLHERYGVAVDVCLHRPGHKGDKRNHHAHLLFTTRRSDGSQLAEKTRVLDDLRTRSEEVEAMRRQWAAQLNKALALAGSSERLDWRSHRRRGREAASGHRSRAELAVSKAEATKAADAERTRRPTALPRPARPTRTLGDPQTPPQRAPAHSATTGRAEGRPLRDAHARSRTPTVKRRGLQR
ncbi:MAG: MobA/MobL family protein [Gemmatimonadota bacterium]